MFTRPIATNGSAPTENSSQTLGSMPGGSSVAPAFSTYTPASMPGPFPFPVFLQQHMSANLNPSNGGAGASAQTAQTTPLNYLQAAAAAAAQQTGGTPNNQGFPLTAFQTPTGTQFFTTGSPYAFSPQAQMAQQMQLLQQQQQQQSQQMQQAVALAQQQQQQQQAAQQQPGPQQLQHQSPQQQQQQSASNLQSAALAAAAAAASGNPFAFSPVMVGGMPFMLMPMMAMPSVMQQMAAAGAAAGAATASTSDASQTQAANPSSSLASADGGAGAAAGFNMAMPQLQALAQFQAQQAQLLQQQQQQQQANTMHGANMSGLPALVSAAATFSVNPQMSGINLSDPRMWAVPPLMPKSMISSATSTPQRATTSAAAHTSRTPASAGSTASGVVRPKAQQASGTVVVPSPSRSSSATAATAVLSNASAALSEFRSAVKRSFGDAAEDYSHTDDESKKISLSRRFVLDEGEPETTVKFLEECVVKYLQEPSCYEQRVIVMHSTVAQRSYGVEKRYLCPPPCVRLTGPRWREDTDIDVHVSVKATCDASVQDVKLEPDESYSMHGVCKHLYVTDQGSSRAESTSVSFHVKLGTDYNIGSFDSSSIAVLSKPVKKVKGDRPQSCISLKTSIALFSRVRGQTVSTRFLGLDPRHSTGFTVGCNGWCDFEFVSGPSGGSASGHKPVDLLFYGETIHLKDRFSGSISPPLRIHKVEGHTIYLDTEDAVSPLMKVALFLPGSGCFLTLVEGTLSLQKAIPYPDNPSRVILMEGIAWTITSTNSNDYCFADVRRPRRSQVAKLPRPMPVVNFPLFPSASSVVRDSTKTMELRVQQLADTCLLFIGKHRAAVVAETPDSVHATVPDGAGVGEPEPVLVVRKDGMVFPTPFLYSQHGGIVRRSTPSQ